jgi:hypothetical protein
VREAERHEQERMAGLLGERWMREPSNGPSAARRERLRDALKRIAREGERHEQERMAGLLGERWMREPSNGPSAARTASDLNYAV